MFSFDATQKNQSAHSLQNILSSHLFLVLAWSFFQLKRYKKADVTQDMVYLKEVNQDPGYAHSALPGLEVGMTLLGLGLDQTPGFWRSVVLFFFGKPTRNLKLTASLPLKMGWLEYDEVSFWDGSL